MAKENSKKADENDPLAKALADIEKAYGKGSTITGNEIVAVERRSTGSIGLDIITGGGYGKGRIIEIYGPESSGKALSIDSNILTPTGWIKMKDVEVGTTVCTPDGGNTTVIGVFPQGKLPLYKVTFDDKTSVEACGEHLWLVHTRGTELGEVLSTKELIKRGIKNERGVKRFKIPNNKPIVLDNGDKQLPIDPYILGLFLGDGSLSTKNIGFTTSDTVLIDVIQDFFDSVYGNVIIRKKQNRLYDYYITKKDAGKAKPAFTLDLISLGLYGCKSDSKFIPDIYKYASVSDRISLLQGLLDSDGSTDIFGASYTTVSSKLSNDFVFVARSLGLRCSTSSRITKYKSSVGKYVDGKRSYRTSILRTTTDFDLFRLEKHLVKRSNDHSTFSNRFIENIEPVGVKECQCIAVGHPDKLYITDDFIVTHNTTITLHAIAEAQRNGEKVVFIDVEHSFDPSYAAALGVDVKNLILSQPNNGEEALDITEKLISSGRVGVVIVDSVAALVPKVELEGEMTDAHMGVHARMMGKAMRKLTGTTSNTGTTLIFINQTRQNIGGYGSPITTSGGNALKFFASIRLEVSKRMGDKSKDGSVEYNTVTVKTVKNKLAPPFQTTSFDINFGEGISKISEVLNYGLQMGMIVRGGSWYSYGDVKLGQGETAVEDYLTSNPEVLEELELNIREHYNIHI